MSYIDISQTDYVDFLSRSGTKKLTKVKTIINRPDYHPAFDFYKLLREEITENQKAEKDKGELLELLKEIVPISKCTRYKSLIDGYFKFLGRKKAKWFNPPTDFWIYKHLRVKLNPELGISFNGEKYIIKLYFKDAALDARDIQILLWMMNQNLCQGIYTGYKCAILDVERGKLIWKTKQDDISALVQGEAECFLKMWAMLNKNSA